MLFVSIALTFNVINEPTPWKKWKFNHWVCTGHGTPWKFLQLIVAPWKVDVLKAGNFLFKEYQISEGQLSASISQTDTIVKMIGACVANYIVSIGVSNCQ